MELHSIDEFTEAEKLVALRDLIEDRAHSVEFELERDWLKKPKPRQPPSRSEAAGTPPDALRDALSVRMKGTKEGGIVSRDELVEATGAGSWRQLAPIVRALVARNVVTANDDQTFTRTGVEFDSL